MGNPVKRRVIAAAILGAAALAWAVWRNRRLFLVHDVTTGETAAYPHLRSRVYYAEPSATLTAAEQAIRILPRWRTVFVDTENDALEAEAETLVGRLLDDVTVYCLGLGHGQTRVVIRSRSRLGRGDLGQNAQHILELQAAMDARLTNHAAF